MAQVDFVQVFALISLTNKKAIEIVRNATEQDSAGNFEEAYKLYQNSLEYFMMAMKCRTLFAKTRREKPND
jgi:hypothetical protein